MGFPKKDEVGVMDNILNSKLYKELLSTYPNVEIWDDEYEEDGWQYWNIVTNQDAFVKKLEYIRFKDSVMQKRTYDENFDDKWIEIE